MKILESELVRRYHVQFSSEETLALKHIGFLPPYAEKEAKLWVTKKELLEQNRVLGVPTLEEIEKVTMLWDSLTISGS